MQQKKKEPKKNHHSLSTKAWRYTQLANTLVLIPLWSNSASHRANHPQQMFRNVHSDLWRRSEEQPSQPLVLQSFFPSPVLCPTRTWDCCEWGCQHYHSSSPSSPPEHSLIHRVSPIRDRSVVMDHGHPWTMRRASLIYTSTNVWTAARAAKNSPMAPRSKKLFGFEGLRVFWIQFEKWYRRAVIAVCDFDVWGLFIRYMMQLSTWIITLLFKHKCLLMCTPLRLLMLNELKQIDGFIESQSKQQQGAL